MADLFYNITGGGTKNYSTAGGMISKQYETKFIVPSGNSINITEAIASYGCTAYSGTFELIPLSITIDIYSHDAGNDRHDLYLYTLMTTVYSSTGGVTTHSSGAIDIDLSAGTYWFVATMAGLSISGATATLTLTENTGETTVNSDSGFSHAGRSGLYPSSYSDNTADLYFKLVGTASTVPSKPTTPTPADAATYVDFSGFELSWVDGGGADTFNVYLGPSGSLSLVSSAQAGVTYTTDATELESLFGVYPVPEDITWRVDATNGNGTTTGDVWTFRAAPGINKLRMGTDGLFTLAMTNQGLYLSSNLGSNWSQALPDSDDQTSWTQGDCSSDGTYIIVVDSDNNVYRSANGGSSWGAITPAGGDTYAVSEVAFDSAGAYVAVVGTNSTTSAESLWVSADYGVTWTTYNPGSEGATWTSCRVGNGGQVISVANNGKMYTSFDFGATWILQSPTGGTTNWGTQAVSNDGKVGYVADLDTVNKVYQTSGWESVPSIDETALTSYARTLLDDTTAPAAATTLGLGTGDSPEFTGLTLSGLTASRLMATDGSSALASVADLTSWVAGTSNEISITADGSGGVIAAFASVVDLGASA